jgi:type II restriction enzyme
MLRLNKRNFDKWFSQIRDQIANYEYYTDFEKVYRNTDTIRVELSMLNSLIGSENIKKDFAALVKRYPETLKCIPILLAVRSKEIYAEDEGGRFTYKFDGLSQSIEQYNYFMDKTGLFELLSKRIVANLIDYVAGVETGLDSNARKNRGGQLMEKFIEKELVKLELKPGQDYFCEMNRSEIEKKWGVSLAALSNRGKTEKRFDFVVKRPGNIYAIETNFYNSPGSKLNETARSYKTLALESMSVPDFTFVWFTDGRGWKQARNNLEEAFDSMEHLYNICDIENGIMRKLFL